MPDDAVDCIMQRCTTDVCVQCICQAKFTARTLSSITLPSFAAWIVPQLGKAKQMLYLAVQLTHVLAEVLLVRHSREGLNLTLPPAQKLMTLQCLNLPGPRPLICFFDSIALTIAVSTHACTGIALCTSSPNQISSRHQARSLVLFLIL